MAVVLTVGGVDVAAARRVLLGSVRTNDTMNNPADACEFNMRGGGDAPVCAQVVTLLIDDVPLFEGTVQSVTLTYQGRPSERLYQVRCIDALAQLARRLVFGVFSGTPYEILTGLIPTLFPDLDITGIVDLGGPAISVTSGGLTLPEFLALLAKLAGNGRYYILDGKLYWESSSGEVEEVPFAGITQPALYEKSLTGGFGTVSETCVLAGIDAIPNTTDTFDLSVIVRVTVNVTGGDPAQLGSANITITGGANGIGGEWTWLPSTHLDLPLVVPDGIGGYNPAPVVYEAPLTFSGQGQYLRTLDATDVITAWTAGHFGDSSYVYALSVLMEFTDAVLTPTGP